jgi:hypothetical protein
MIELNIQVTEQDIALGYPRNANYCPVARAIERTVVNYFKLDLNKDYISVNVQDGMPEFSILRPGQHEEYRAYDVYLEIDNFIQNFDHQTILTPDNEKVKPFELIVKFDNREGDTEF